MSGVLSEAGRQPCAEGALLRVPAGWEGSGIRVAAEDAVSRVTGGWQCPLADSGLTT